MAGNKENMKQAMKELLGMVGIGSEQEQDEPNMEREEEEDRAMEKEQFRGTGSETQFSGGLIHHTEEDGRSFRPEPSSYVPAAVNGTMIAAGTSIFGDIRSEGDVEIRGKLKGNLEAAGNVRVSGKVLGDVKGNNVELLGCAVQGNITAGANMNINVETIVVGDLVAESLTTDGKIKGNVQVEKTAIFQKNAVLLGNVAASLVTMSEGAKVQGTVRISEDSDANALFGDNLDI